MAFNDIMMVTRRLLQSITDSVVGHLVKHLLWVYSVFGCRIPVALIKLTLSLFQPNAKFNLLIFRLEDIFFVAVRSIIYPTEIKRVLLNHYIYFYIKSETQSVWPSQTSKAMPTTSYRLYYIDLKGTGYLQRSKLNLIISLYADLYSNIF